MTRIRTLVHYTNPPALAGGCSVRLPNPLTKVTLTKNTKWSADGKITTIDKKDSAAQYYRYSTTPN
jgi:hypothetical protein